MHPHEPVPLGRTGRQPIVGKVEAAVAASASAPIPRDRWRVLINLARVVDRACDEDLRMLIDLVAERGAEHVAGIQAGIDATVGHGCECAPITTAAIRSMANHDEVARAIQPLLPDAGAAAEGARIIERQAWHVVVAGITGEDDRAESPRDAVPQTNRG